MRKGEIYLDNAATTAIDPQAEEAMRPLWSNVCGNPSSIHTMGTQAKELLENSRETIASILGASPQELVFTGSGTEANNLALKGIAFEHRNRGNHLIVSSIEHDCILKSCQWLESQGFYVTYIPVDRYGIVDLDFLSRAINRKTILVSVMHANNEIGTIEPVREVAALCRERGVLFHSDCCQSFGKIPVKADETGFDLITINAHKIHGPKGIGALYIRRGTKITPLLHGGGQEMGIRSSTENTAGAVGFAKAARIAEIQMESEMSRMAALNKKISEYLKRRIPGIYFNGHPYERISNNLNFCIENMEGEGIRLQLLLNERGIYVSTGSACSSNDNGNPSHVLQAIGLDPFQSRGAIRISFGRFTTEEEVMIFAETLSELTYKLKPIH